MSPNTVPNRVMAQREHFITIYMHTTFYCSSQIIGFSSTSRQDSLLEKTLQLTDGLDDGYSIFSNKVVFLIKIYILFFFRHNAIAHFIDYNAV